MASSKTGWLRGACIGLGCLFGLFVITALLMTFSVSSAGGIVAWESELNGASTYLLLLRLAIYAGLGISWFKIRKRILLVDQDEHAAARLKRSGFAAAACIGVFELSRIGVV